MQLPIRTTHLRLSLSLGALLLVSACGGDGGIEFEDLEDEIRNTLCDHQFECGLVPDKATCLAAIDIQLGQFAAEIEAGLIDYNSAKAGECLDSIRTSGCSIFNILIGQNAACDEMLLGTIAIGDSCITGESCGGSAFCDGTEAEACIPGVCVAIEPNGKEGESCANSFCEEGLDCVDDICKVLAGPDEVCKSFFGTCVDGYI